MPFFCYCDFVSKTFFEVFFHFFGRRLLDNTNAVVVNFYILVLILILVLGLPTKIFWINSYINSGFSSVSCVIFFGLLNSLLFSVSIGLPLHGISPNISDTSRWIFVFAFRAITSIRLCLQ